jgi:hypothetical protein
VIQQLDAKIENNSRNDFIGYTSNTGGSSIQRDDVSKELINNVKVKDYVQMKQDGRHTIGFIRKGSKKTPVHLSYENVSSTHPNELNEFNFYTPNNQQNVIKSTSSNQMYMVNKHPLSGTGGYARGVENDRSISLRKKSKSRVKDHSNQGYSSRLK